MLESGKETIESSNLEFGGKESGNDKERLRKIESRRERR